MVSVSYFSIMARDRKFKEYEDKGTEEIMKRVARRFIAIRQQQGYTSQEIFAYEKDINRVQYSRYERGKDFRFTTFLEVLDALGVTVEEFFNEEF